MGCKKEMKAHKLELFDKKEVIIIPEAPIEEDPERAVSSQELINALEECISKLEDFDDAYDTCAIEQVVNDTKKTVILVCKILAVELDKIIPEELRDSDIFYFS